MPLRSVTASDKKRYVLADERDYKILGLCKALEQKELSPIDAAQVALVKTQLEKDWRTPLIRHLKRLIKRYI